MCNYVPNDPARMRFYPGNAVAARQRASEMATTREKVLEKEWEHSVFFCA